ncbi:hypothetical protein [Psychroflexus maritimus]|uniref:Uncharacterized protein n=1 Tax=Psychroflexus maritimus TaxID=2714865 RepID=A0A967E0A0_9FLAO|nr:hypothetical protein [Psychroflexus maritimus]NGZ90397.1 hypothetical protein [Psychroflexus maritimus]
MVNDFALTFQALNPFDERVTTLQGYGVNNTEQTDAGAKTISSFMPVSQSSNQFLRVFNASQFSKNFKGSFMTKTSHKMRGFYNRTYNRIARNINEASLYKNFVEFKTSVLEKK